MTIESQLQHARELRDETIKLRREFWRDMWFCAGLMVLLAAASYWVPWSALAAIAASCAAGVNGALADRCTVRIDYLSREIRVGEAFAHAVRGLQK